VRSLIRRKWAEFTQWLAWAAWNHARKRAIRREPWLPQDAKQARGEDTLQQRRITGNEARQILDNQHFKAAWESLDQALESQIMGCDPADEKQAARIIVSKQLLHGLRRELVRKLDDGYMAEVELEEIRRRNRPVRMVR
jgi:hypothetical protein